MTRIWEPNKKNLTQIFEEQIQKTAHKFMLQTSAGTSIIHFVFLKWHFRVEVNGNARWKSIRVQLEITITYRIIYYIVNNIDGLALSKTNNLIGF